MKIAFWNILFGVAFVSLIITGFGWLMGNGLLFRALTLGDFALMALAIFRLIRLVSYDAVTEFIRAPLSRTRAGTFLGTFSSLVNCPWCAGLWLSAFVVFFYYASPLAWPFILILALAGVASFIQILANLVGWYAEGEKQVVLEEGETRTKCE